MAFHAIGIKEVEDYRSRPNTRLIDMRTKAEYEREHLKGAEHVPFRMLENYMEKLPKDTIYILYCQRGGNSLLAARQTWKEGISYLHRDWRNTGLLGKSILRKKH